jgi:hypothetical protein
MAANHYGWVAKASKIVAADLRTGDRRLPQLMELLDAFSDIERNNQALVRFNGLVKHLRGLASGVGRMLYAEAWVVERAWTPEDFMETFASLVTAFAAAVSDQAQAQQEAQAQAQQEAQAQAQQEAQRQVIIATVPFPTKDPDRWTSYVRNSPAFFLILAGPAWDEVRGGAGRGAGALGAGARHRATEPAALLPPPQFLLLWDAPNPDGWLRAGLALLSILPVLFTKDGAPPRQKIGDWLNNDGVLNWCRGFWAHELAEQWLGTKVGAWLWVAGGSP